MTEEAKDVLVALGFSVAFWIVLGATVTLVVMRACGR